MEDFIKIRGARVHNLKNVSLDIPRNKFVVLTGLSGSGKSSLAFDTIYAEGQRRYVESLSAYARQFLGLMDKPDVDEITGLSPTISIDQRSSSQNPRSTVGTTTEIYDYLRLLFARIGIPHCPQCGKEIKKQTVDQIVDRIIVKGNALNQSLRSGTGQGTEALLLAPLVRDQKGEHKHLLDAIRKAGYSRVRFDDIVYDCDEVERLTIDKQKKHTVEVVIDRTRVVKEKDDVTRLRESVEAGLKLGNGLIQVEIVTEDGKAPEELLFSQHFSCPSCGIDLSEIEPRSFSFNSPHGACKECSGLGTKLEVDPELVVLNPRLTVAQGAIRPWARLTGQHWLFEELVECAKKNNFSVHVPFEKLTKDQQKIVLYGSKQEGFEGVIPNLERRYKETDSDYMRGEIERYMRVYACPLCKGKRLKPEALAVTVDDTSIATLVAMTITDAAKFFIALKLSVRETTIAKQILKEINARLHFLQNVGLNYLTLDRTTASLSGGEAQRIRLATQIGSALVGVTYILDEPSIG
ncbi:excinuclease ABC subunit UvrA, partial [Candidatus Uhrbacteria bacterium]|nr:excinuclease ABC subunit UvrA [Candidatus Uhrbacteria bacterium]